MHTKPISVGELFATFRNRPRRQRIATYVSVPSVVFLLAITLGLVARRGGTAAFQTGETPEQFLPGSSMTAAEIFLNNSRVLLAILVGGIFTLSLGVLFVSLFNGIHIGSGIGILTASYGPTTAIAAVAPHGFLEVAAYVVAGSVSVRVSLLVVAARAEGGDPGPRMRDVLAESLALVLLAMVLLATAAVIESNVTPSIVRWIAS